MNFAGSSFLNIGANSLFIACSRLKLKLLRYFLNSKSFPWSLKSFSIWSIGPWSIKSFQFFTKFVDRSFLWMPNSLSNNKILSSIFFWFFILMLYDIFIYHSLLKLRTKDYRLKTIVYFWLRTTFCSPLISLNSLALTLILSPML